MRGVRVVEGMVAVFGRVSAALFVAIAVAQVALLVARKAGFATVAAQESVSAFAVPAVLFAIPWALQAGRHVAVDALGRPARALGPWLALLLALALLWFTVPYAWASFRAGEGSYEMAGFAFRWAAKAALPLFALLLAAQAVASIVRSRWT